MSDENLKGIEESYISNDIRRSVITIEDGNEIEIKPLAIGNSVLSCKITNLSELGSVGSFLDENIGALGVPIVNDEYDVPGANLNLHVLDGDSLTKNGVENIAGTRVFLVENSDKNIKVYFRVPELDIAEIFAIEIKDSDEFEREIVYLSGNKNLVNGPEDSVDFLDYSRRMYGVWKYAVDEGRLDRLDSLMHTVYPEVGMPKDPSVESLIMFVHDSVKAEEGDRPAENWWKTKFAVNELIKVIEKDNDLDKNLDGVLEIIRVISEKTFSPEQLWIFVIEPLMNEYCGENHGINRYEKKAFLEKVVNDSGVVWLSDVPGFKSIMESEE